MIHLEQQVASTYRKARRKEAYHRLRRLVLGETPSQLVDFDELRDRLRLFEQSYWGIRPIPVEKIVGSVSRAEDFDRDFLPRADHIRQRWLQLERAFPDSNFPPIQVYKVRDVYFVSDGHHRVGIARQRGVEFLDAEITEVFTRYDIGSDIDFGKIIHLEQERIFMEESGLARALPEVHIEFTRPQGYPELLDLIKVHGYQLMMERERLMSPETIATHWYDHVYLPALDAIHEKRLREVIHCTDGDVFLWVNQRRRETFPVRGATSFEAAAQQESPPGSKRIRPKRSKPSEE